MTGDTTPTRLEAMLEVLSVRCAQEGIQIGAGQILELLTMLDEAESMIGARVQLGAATALESDWITRFRARLDIDCFLEDEDEDEVDAECDEADDD